MARKPPTKTTTERGYGYSHRQWAGKLPNPNHTPCPRCGRPMLPGQKLDLGHVVDVARGGKHGARRWEHARCNRSAGARLGQAMRGHKVRAMVTRLSRQW